MRSVTDRDGRKWTLDITVLTVERVKAACNVDMPGLFGDKMAGLDALLFDLKFPEVVYECCRTAAARDGLTIEQLKEGWNGDFADLVIEAWLEELIDFFPNVRKREALRKALAALREMNTQFVEQTAAMVTPAAMEADLARALALVRPKSPATSGEPSGNSPAISDSTLAPSLSVS